MKSEISFGESCAVMLSKFMATWTFIALLAIGLTAVIVARHLVDGAPLDVFNLGVSLYTLFIDLIILKSAISLRNMDRAMMETMLKLDRKILVKEEEQSKLLKELMVMWAAR